MAPGLSHDSSKSLHRGADCYAARFANFVGLVTLPPTPHFLWITQFPLFTRADEDKSFLSQGRWASTHHPFTAPIYEDLSDLKVGKIEGVRGQHYDLVLNGQEIGGGSVRIHDARLQEYVMREVLQVGQLSSHRGEDGHLTLVVNARGDGEVLTSASSAQVRRTASRRHSIRWGFSPLWRPQHI
jgi:hypothetical protein